MCDLTHTLKDMVVLTVSKTDDTEESLRSRQYSIPAEYVEEVNGAKFLCLARKEVVVRRLLTLQARVHVNTSHADEGITNMSLTDVPDQLAVARVNAIKLGVAGTIEKAEKLSSKFYRSKKYQQALTDMGEVINVTTPHVGDLQPIVMRMLARPRGMSWVEITDANLSWLTKAVAIQVAEGCHTSMRSKRARCDASDDDDECSADDDEPQSVNIEPQTVVCEPVEPSCDVASPLPPMPKRSPTPEPKGCPVQKRTGKLTDFFRQSRV